MIAQLSMPYWVNYYEMICTYCLHAFVILLKASEYGICDAIDDVISFELILIILFSITFH